MCVVLSYYILGSFVTQQYITDTCSVGVKSGRIRVLYDLPSHGAIVQLQGWVPAWSLVPILGCGKPYRWGL